MPPAYHDRTSNLPHSKNKNHPIGWFCFWRSRRDSNSRAAFGDYTISSRARYDHFDTTPYSLGLRDSMDYYTKVSAVVKKKITKNGTNFLAAAKGAADAPCAAAVRYPDFGYIMSLTDSIAWSTAVPTRCIALPIVVFSAFGWERIAALMMAPTTRPAPIPHKYEPV